MLIKKISDVSGVMSTTVLNTKIKEVESNIPDLNGLVTTLLLFLIQKLEKLRTQYQMVVV